MASTIQHSRIKSDIKSVVSGTQHSRLGRSELTVLSIRAMKPGQWASDTAVRGAGQLQVRCLTHGAPAFYYRYIDSLGKQVRLPLGSGLTLAEARLKATSLSRLYQEGERDLRSVFQIGLRSSFGSNASSLPEPTLGTLLLAYVDDLKARGRSSAREVHNAVLLHVKRSWPELWKKDLHLIATDDVLLVIRHIVDQGKLREADKVRCHIRAAFACAISARQDASSLPSLQILRVSSNPARDIPAIRQAKRVKERALSLDELQTYWGHIKNRGGAGGALLRFHLLTGGQRVEQLRRATLEDIDHDIKALVLHDPKGRRLDARVHVVPLLPEAFAAIQTMQTGLDGQYLWTVTAGRSGAWYTTVDKELKAVIAEIPQSQLPGGAFTLGDLRRTVETRLAAAGVNREIRAQLQSHGLSGVQTRHYDRHDYLKEKQAALETLYGLLVGASKSSPSSAIQQPQVEASL